MKREYLLQSPLPHQPQPNNLTLIIGVFQAVGGAAVAGFASIRTATHYMFPAFPFDPGASIGESEDSGIRGANANST